METREVKGSEVILGLDACPFCGSPTEIEFGIDSENQEILFRAVCTNSECGCNSGLYKSIRATQDRWNSVSALKNAASRETVQEVDETGYTYITERIPSQKEAVDHQDQNGRTYNLMNIITKGSNHEIVGYYDSKEFRRMDTNAIIRDVKCYKVISGRYALVTKAQNDEMRRQEQNQ